MIQNIEILLPLCLLTVISFIFAIANIRHLKPFWKHKSRSFIKQRKPVLLILYTVLSSILLFIIIPNICASIYIHSLDEARGHSVDEWWLTYYFIFDSIHGSIFCTFINIIAIRVWLLFYEHKFAIATVDKIWRNIINSNDNNFYLNKRNTFGNDRFLLKILFTIWIFTVFVILFIVIIFLSPSSPYIHVDKYLFLALRVCIAFPVSIFIFIIYHKIKQINDEFNIRREMKYLSYLVCFVIFTSCINLILLVFCNIPTYSLETIIYSFDVIFIFSTNYIQTKWVLNVFLKTMRNPVGQHTKPKHHKLSMIDILRKKNMFEAFMRHCVKELSVESLLFLVEVAQYKATLSSYNAPDKESQSCFINVQKENVRHILLESRRKKRSIGNNDEKQEEEQNDGSHAMSKQEVIFQEFETSILNHKGLHSSLQLNLSKSLLFVSNELATKSRRNLWINVDHLQLQNVASDSKSIKCQSTPSFTPTTSITDDKCNRLSLSPHCTVSSEWIRNVALTLYNKYLATNSELSINVSSMTREFLIDLFNKSHIGTFEYIMEHSGGELDESKQCPAAINEQLLINTYLYHVFDESFEEIWNLLRANAFTRFTMTKQYQQFVKKMEMTDSIIIYQSSEDMISDK